MIRRAHPSAQASSSARARPERRGKFLFAGESKLYVRGVTYGTFRPNEEGALFPTRDVVARDFAAMVAAGINTVRTYTVPPGWLLDLADRHGLYVIVGIPWEQHVAFLHGRRDARSIERRVRDGVRACAGHPAVLAYAIGNEIPSSIVRWHGRRAIKRFLEHLYRRADLKAAFPAVPGSDLEAFLHWARTHGPGESGYAKELAQR